MDQAKVADEALLYFVYLTVWTELQWQFLGGSSWQILHGTAATAEKVTLYWGKNVKRNNCQRPTAEATQGQKNIARRRGRM